MYLAGHGKILGPTISQYFTRLIHLFTQYLYALTILLLGHTRDEASFIRTFGCQTDLVRPCSQSLRVAPECHYHCPLGRPPLYPLSDCPDDPSAQLELSYKTQRIQTGQ